MAYDKIKAHEYYEQYRKKGLLKGRKKGTKKKTGSGKVKKTNLLGQSTSGLNDDGRIQAAMIKEKMTAQMNAALAKATTQEEKDQIRLEYSQNASKQIQALKDNPSYAQAKKEKLKTSSAKGKGKSSSKGGGGSSDNEKSAKEESQKKKKKRKAAIKKIKAQIEIIKGSIKDLPEKQKAIVRERLDTLLKRIKALKG